MFGFRIVKKPRRKKPRKERRKLSFLDFAIAVVFVTTFIFTYCVFKQVSQVEYWDPGVMVSLIDNWFRIMVGELLVGGLIAISKNVCIERESIPCVSPTVILPPGSAYSVPEGQGQEEQDGMDA